MEYETSVQDHPCASGCLYPAVGEYRQQDHRKVERKEEVFVSMAVV